MMNEKMLKYCYDVAIGFDEAIKPDKTLTSHLDLSAIISNAKMYAVEVLNQDEEYASNMILKNRQKISGFLRRENLGSKYLNDNRINDAKHLIEKFVKNKELSVAGICVKEGITLADFEEYANVVRLTNPELYSKYKEKYNPIVEPGNYSEDQRQIQKYCYDILKQNNWSTAKFSNINNLSAIKIRKNALIYATEVLKMTKDEFYYEKYINGKEKTKLNTNNDKKYYVLYEELLDASSNQEELTSIVNKYYLECTTKKIAILKSKAAEYALSHMPFQRDAIAEELKEKISISHKDVIENNISEGYNKRNKAYTEKTKSLELPEAIKFFEGYVRSPLNRGLYRVETKVQNQKYYYYEKLIKMYAEDLYEKVKEKDAAVHLEMLRLARVILDRAYIKSDFSIEDYNGYTSISPEQLYKEVKENLSAIERKFFQALKLQDSGKFRLGEKHRDFDNDLYVDYQKHKKQRR